VDRAQHLARADRDARALGQERAEWTDAFALRVKAGVQQVRGDEAGAIASLRAALPGLDRGGFAVQAAAVRRRLGQLTGGDEGRALVGAGEELMRERSIADIEAATRMYTW
jgi:hypothetical protein